jgi:selenocysteine-specific elongation factor
VLALARDGGPTRYATPAWIDAQHERVTSELAAYHAAHPLRAGMSLEELRTRAALSADDFALVATEWHDVAVERGHARLSDFAPSLTDVQRAQIDAYLQALRSHPGGAPPELPPDLLAYAIANGEAIAAGDLVFDADTVERMTTAVREHLQQHGSISLARARDLLGTNRRTAQALLEHLDRQHVTRRLGDARVLR